MNNQMISEQKINRIAKDWANLIFKVGEKEKKRLYITLKKRNTLYGYIDLTNNTVCPNTIGVSYRHELESILKDLTE